MKGDFSRIRFNPSRRYTSVLEQQGRVAVDADSNEQAAINSYLRETINADVIGPFGAPEHAAGFQVEISGDEIVLSAGRYYVDGILVENPLSQRYDDQPYLIDPEFHSSDLLRAVENGSSVQLQLEVWQRMVTRLDDPCLNEPALGQADTTVRVQTVWRVVGKVQRDSTSANAPLTRADSIFLNRLAGLQIERDSTILNTENLLELYKQPLTSADSQSSSGETSVAEGPIAALSSCCQLMYGAADPVRTGVLQAFTNPAGADCGCQPIPSAGYQGLENQLYRVEVQRGGTLDRATFKWSRENGSIVTQIIHIGGAVLTVQSLGPDANLGYQPGQWVELSDDSYLFGQTPNRPGDLYQILSLSPNTLQVTLNRPVTSIDPLLNARMRRWDQSGASATERGVALSTSALPLENGIEVNFRSGQYLAGDYWTFVARTATGKIEWPPCDSNGEQFQKARFTKIHVAPIACIHLAAAKAGAPSNTINKLAPVDRSRLSISSQAGSRFVIDDCRLLFPPLNELLGAGASSALHVKSISWQNDQPITVDTLITKGLSVILDQAPGCPWSGANFQVILEVPAKNAVQGRFGDIINALLPQSAFEFSFNSFLRTPTVLDPPTGIVVQSATVNWLLPGAQITKELGNDRAVRLLYFQLNTLLAQTNANALTRMRIRLLGGAVYAAGTNGSKMYLDGQSFGTTVQRKVDKSDSISLTSFKGDSSRATDFEGWLYLAPTVLISSVEIDATVAGKVIPTNFVVVAVDFNGTMSGLVTVDQTGAPGVTLLHITIQLSYTPVEATTITLQLTGQGAGTTVTVPPTVSFAAGQASQNVPITVQATPGPAVTQNITFIASVGTAVGNISADQQPVLTVTGGHVPIRPPR